MIESIASDSPGSSLAGRLPSLSGQVAAGVTGAVVGFAGVILTVGALRGCEAVRNTATCGAAGFPLLIAVLLLMVVIGRILLGAWKVPDPSGTAFLAVGLVAMLSMLFFMNILLQWYMVIVLPLVSVIAHMASHFVTTAYVDLDEDDYEKVSTT